MKKIRQTINRISCGLVMAGAVVSPILMSSCSPRGIIFADYESYISENLIKTMHSKWGVNMMYYATNEDIQAKFKNSYDIAVPSTYTILDMIPQLAEYDWRKFDVYSNPDLNSHTSGEHEQIEYARPYNWYPSSETDPVEKRDKQIEEAQKDPKNAWCLLSDVTVKIIAYVDDYAHDNGFYPSSVVPNDPTDTGKTLLNYAIPYFLQDVMMAYHGNYIAPNPDTNFKGLPAPEKDLDYQSNVNWSELTNIVAPKIWNGDSYSDNHNWDDRFQPKNQNHMNMIDDSRTFYDICHIINDEQNEKVDPKVNPDDSELGISSIKNIYSQFTNKFNPNTIYLNSDSQQVLYPFANPKNPNDPNTLAQSNAAIFYSGDCLYAAMGSGIDAWSDTWHAEPETGTTDGPLTQGNFHIVKPKDSLVCMDMVVMNKKDVDSKRENNIYNAIRKVTLEGCDAEPLTKSNDQNRTAIGEYSGSDDDRDFEYGPMDNFYQIAYTSPLFSVNTYVARDVGDEPDNSFFDSLYPNNPNKAELLAEINNINFKNGLLEEPLSNLTKSNMSFLYQEYKEKM